MTWSVRTKFSKIFFALEGKRFTPLGLAFCFFRFGNTHT